MLLLAPGFLPADRCEELIRAFRHVASMPDPVAQQVVKTAKRTEISGRLFKETHNTELTSLLGHVRQDAMDAIRDFYKLSRACYIDFTLVTEMREGDAHPLHADNERLAPEGDWIPNHTAWRDYTAMLYLNTSGVDYSGGILRFPELDQSIVPEAGFLVGFSCGHQHRHEVTPVYNGSRYAVSIWMTHDPWFTESWDSDPAANGMRSERAT